MNKEIKKLLIVLMILSFGDGLFYNFQELWMTESGLSLRTISIVLCLSALISCSIIFLSSNLIHQRKLKKFTLGLMFLKSLITTILFGLYKSDFKILIKFLVMIDYAIDVEILACMYPLMSIINKNDKLYGKKTIVYNGFYYLGSLTASFFVGKVLFGSVINYNTYAIIMVLLVILAFFIMHRTDVEKYLKNEKKSDDYDIFISLIKNLKKDKISIYYLLFSFFGNVSFNIVVGMVMLLLVTKLSFSDSLAGYITLGSGVTSALSASLILSKLTSKNNYFNIGVKYVGRIIIYSITLLFTCKATLILSILYTMITSTWYADITDAPYINRFNSTKQLAFANLKEMVSYFSKSFGILIGGIGLLYSFKINYILAIIFATLGVLFIYKALYLFNKEVV